MRPHVTRLVAAGAIAALTPALFAQATPANPAFNRVRGTIMQQTRALSVTPEGLCGPGGELLLREAIGADFLAIGESHGTAETPAFVASMLAPLAEAGYAAFAIEMGERVADFAGEHIVRDPETVASLLREKPFSAAFMYYQPEFDALLGASRLGMELWGLDQVFMGGARFNLAELARIAPDEGARSVAAGKLRKAQAGFARFAQTGDQAGAFLRSATESDFDELRAAFRESAEGLRIIDEIESSARIYRLFGAGQNYQSNLERIDLMRRHLAERVRGLEPGGKVLLKFGAIHMGRGYSMLNQLDLGAAITGLGDLAGGGALHVLVASAEFYRTDDQTAGDALLDEAIGENRWVVIDLRPLRAIFHREANRVGLEDLSDRAWRYDLLVVAERFTEAPLVPGTPPLPR